MQNEVHYSRFMHDPLASAGRRRSHTQGAKQI
jgi:hypothetical protein